MFKATYSDIIYHQRRSEDGAVSLAASFALEVIFIDPVLISWTPA